MNFRSILSGLAVAVAMTGSAAAAPTTYNIDQAFWGTYPILSTMGTDVWQAQRQAAVDANPGNFAFLTGWLTVDWSTFSVLDYALNMDININGAPTVAHFTPSDPDSTSFGGHNATGNSDWITLDMSTRYGPMVERAGETSELYRGELYFSMAHFLANDDITLLMTNAYGAEFVEVPDLCNPYIGCMSTAPAYLNLQSNRNPTTNTYGGGYGVTTGASAPPVPLPAGIWLMVSGLGALGAAGGYRRRRKAAPELHDNTA